MKYITLFPGGQEVSKLAIGSVFFGTIVSRKNAFDQLDCFYAQGGNFIDTAHVYAQWLPGGYLASEKTIGAWIRDRKLKNSIILSTKGAHPLPNQMTVPRLNKKELDQDLEESLESLNIDCIDLYFLHRDDPILPVEEILSLLERYKKEGKIKHYGCSNWKLNRIIEADTVSAKMGCEGFVCNQIMWSMADINWKDIKDKTLIAMDTETYNYHTKTQKIVMAFSSSCKGYFSKRISGQAIKPDVKDIYDTPSNERLIKRLAELSAEYQCSPAVLVSAYIMNQKFPAIPIASFTSLPQLEETLRACDFEFPGSVIEEIRLSREYII
jgi:aryl-alcohol dehydrogenase-like predicted oxidoreductase